MGAGRSLGLLSVVPSIVIAHLKGYAVKMTHEEAVETLAAEGYLLRDLSELNEKNLNSICSRAPPVQERSYLSLTP
jgi:hypothetical protein